MCNREYRKEYILNDQGILMSYEDFWEYYKKKIEEKYQKGQISSYQKEILLKTKQLELEERIN